jgi:acetyltransferase (GNAT) family protein
MLDARKTGISSISGKIVVIRHATDRDRVIVEEYLRNNGPDAGTDGSEIAIALENERIIGFGILKKEREGGCVSLFEDSRRKGIASPIVKHLMEYAGLTKVYATRNATYFTRSKLVRGKQALISRSSKKGFLCRAPLMEPLPLAV